MDILKTPLMGFLKANHDVYPGKVLELREAISGWLSYIPQTFPHYTRHTVDHSDEIVLQMSKLLFRGNNPAEPVIPISATEAYIAIAAAYLHDAGMVCSDREKTEILESEAWKEWVTGSGTGAERWAATQAFRSGGGDPQDEAIRNFLADVQTRFLLAEFIRRTHHRRAVSILEQHQATLGRFALDNPALLRVISNVCVAHGLREHELEDRERYPEECDIGPDRVNVRFAAILLRLGDLLDMRHDRACPLLLNPACPLPSDSLAHWAQYRHITHRLTSPTKIELAAECETQEEHRVLQDWCQWLVYEVRGARTLMARAARHSEWGMPQAELIGPGATIRIRPAQTAKYLPFEWRFELDKEVVFNLLIRDVYTSKNIFIRELLQNAFDASRCQMYLDMIHDGEEPPEYPNYVDEGRRKRYPTRVSLVERPVPNELSGKEENKQFVVVEDFGIGMDKEIIQRYFLQVGRSFYVTDEFQRSFRFVPTSRFGVGFLSVFAVSDRVVVESYKPTSHAQDGPMRLTLTGPKSYLLTERGDRRVTGTKIEVALSEPFKQGELTKLVSDWCRRVEFPILVNDLGETGTVSAEQPASLIGEEPDLADPEASFVVRCFPIVAPGVSGEIYIFSHAFAKGESWVDWGRARFTYLEQNPRATIPHIPERLTCFHGIRVSRADRGDASFAIRLDIRKGNHPVTLTREHVLGHEARHWTQDYPPEVVERFGEILSEHMNASPFAKGIDGWKYKQRLIEKFPLPISFWRTVPGTVGTIINQTLTHKSIAELEEEDSITVAVPVGWSRHDKFSVREKWVVRMLLRPTVLQGIVIPAYYLSTLEDICRTALLSDRYVADVRFVSNSVMAFVFRRDTPERSSRVMFGGNRSVMLVASFPDAESIGVEFHLSYSTPSLIILNSQNIFAQWYLRVQKACQASLFSLNTDMLERLERLLGSAISYPYPTYVKDLAAYVDAWSTIPGLPPELYPPTAKLEWEGFLLHRRKPIRKLPRRRGTRRF